MRKGNLFVVVILLIGIFFGCSKQQKLPANYFFKTDLTTDELNKGMLSPEILWKFGRISDAQISPDGKWVLYSVKRYNLTENKGNAEIFKVAIGGGEPVQLTYTNESEYNARWIENGNKIAFLSPKSGLSQIWEMNLDGSNVKQISNTDYDVEFFAFAPVGDKLLFTARVKTDTSAQDRNADLPLSTGRVFTDLMYRHWDSWTDYKHSHIFVADIANSQLSNAEDILKSEPFDAPLSPYYDGAEISWSPDGKQIAYTCRKLFGKTEALSTNSDIYIYSLDNKETKNITEGNPGYDRYPVFSPNGKKIAYTSMATAGYESDKDRLMVKDFESGEVTDFTKDFDQSVASINWSEDGSVVYFISGFHATFQIYSFSWQTKEIKQLTKGWHDYTSLSRAHTTMIGERMSFTMASEIYKIDENGTESQITHTNENIYNGLKMGEVREKWINTTDNKKMLVWLVLPPNFDSTKTYPSLLYCQGGPQSAVSHFFSYRWNLALMAANGYIVIAPNRRGLPTFGSEWNDEIAGNYGGQNIKDYISAIDEIKKEPYINSNAIGAVGASYGGFSVYYLAGMHNKRFKAFIAHCGMFNLESQYASTEEFFFTNHDLGGAYWENPRPQSYDFSPHHMVQNWDTPIMIVSGENDFRIPYTESLQAFNAAQLRGIPSKLLIFPDESHWVLKPQNSVLWQREFFDWLDKWLKK